MGVIKPPWISEEWFLRCPFNYCDHFGDKKVLAKICKICREDVERLEEYEREDKDPYDVKNVLADVAESFAETIYLLRKSVEKMGIDLDNMEYEEKEKIDPRTFPIYKLAEKYGDRVEKEMKNLGVVPIDVDVSLVANTIDVLAHSRSYVCAKIYRAISSSEVELRDSMGDLHDSKTSAFFAYIAILRNCNAMLALATHKPLRDLREKHLKFAQLSIKIAESIRKSFFPKDQLIYEEVGL